MRKDTIFNYLFCLVASVLSAVAWFIVIVFYWDDAGIYLLPSLVAFYLLSVVFAVKASVMRRQDYFNQYSSSLNQTIAELRTENIRLKELAGTHD